MTTAKDTKYAKVETTGTIHSRRGPSWNPATVRDSKASTAINEDAGKPKSRIDLRAHQSFALCKMFALESFFIQRTAEITGDGRKTRKQTRKRTTRSPVHFMVLRALVTTPHTA